MKGVIGRREFFIENTAKFQLDALQISRFTIVIYSFLLFLDTRGDPERPGGNRNGIFFVMLYCIIIYYIILYYIK